MVGEPLGDGDGDGLGDVAALELGLGLGLGLELAEVFSVDVGLGLGLGEVPDGDGDEVEVDALGLDAGLAGLAGSLLEADALGEAGWLVLAVMADLLGDAKVPAEELPDVEELRAAGEFEPAWVADL